MKKNLFKLIFAGLLLLLAIHAGAQLAQPLP